MLLRGSYFHFLSSSEYSYLILLYYAFTSLCVYLWLVDSVYYTTEQLQYGVIKYAVYAVKWKQLKGAGYQTAEFKYTTKFLKLILLFSCIQKLYT